MKASTNARPPLTKKEKRKRENHPLTSLQEITSSFRNRLSRAIFKTERQDHNDKLLEQILFCKFVKYPISLCDPIRLIDHRFFQSKYSWLNFSVSLRINERDNLSHFISSQSIEKTSANFFIEKIQKNIYIYIKYRKKMMTATTITIVEQQSSLLELLSRRAKAMLLFPEHKPCFPK